MCAWVHSKCKCVCVYGVRVHMHACDCARVCVWWVLDCQSPCGGSLAINPFVVNLVTCFHLLFDCFFSRLSTMISGHVVKTKPGSRSLILALHVMMGFRCTWES